MPEFVHVGTVTPQVLCGAGQAKRLTNAGTGSLYLGGPTVTSATPTYTVATLKAQVVFGPIWGVGSVKTNVICEDVPVGLENKINPSTRYWPVPQTKAATAQGTNTTVVANTIYVGQINIPQRTVLTGAAYLVGTTGGTNNSCVVLYDYLGAPLAWSALAGTIVGSANGYDSRDFIAPFDVLAPGRYLIGVAYNGTTATLQVEDGSAGVVGATSVVGGNVAAAVNFSTNPVKIVAPTAVGASPVMFTY